MRVARGSDPAETTTPAAGSRSAKLAFALFAAAVFASLAWTVHPWWDLKNADAGLYFATARSIAAGEGYALNGVPFTMRAPGFPLLAALVVGTGEPDFHALNLFVSAFGAAAVVLLALFQRERLGAPLALLVAFALWVNPGYQRLCNQLLSDVPGLALLLACLCLERWASRAPSWWREALLGLLLGAAIAVRPAAFLLLAAIAASRAIEHARARRGGVASRGWAAFAARRLAVFALVAVLLALPWMSRDRALAPEAPVDQTGMYSHWTAMWHEDAGDPDSPRLTAGELLERAPTRALQIANALGSRLQTSLPSPGRTLVTLLLVAGLVGVLVRRCEPAEIFAVVTLVLLLVYFDVRERLLLPVYAIALPASALLLRDVLRSRLPPRAAELAVAAVLAGIVVLDWHPRRDWSSLEEKHVAFQEICKAVQWALEPDARVATAFNWHYATCLDRPVYSLLFAVRRAEDPAAAEAVIDALGINTVVLTPFWVLDRALYPYFDSHYGDVKHVGNAYVFRVRP